MIIALLLGGLLAFFFAGDDSAVRPQVLRERIEMHVSEEARKAQALDEVDTFAEVVEQLRDEQSETAEALADELTKASASRAEIDKLFAASDASQLKAIEGLADLREETKGILTAEEWPKVFVIEQPSGN